MASRCSRWSPRQLPVLSHKLGAAPRPHRPPTDGLKGDHRRVTMVDVEQHKDAPSSLERAVSPPSPPVRPRYSSFTPPSPLSS